MKIAPIADTWPVSRAEPSREAASPSAVHGDVSFGDVLGKLVQEVNQTDAVATTKVQSLAQGVNDDLHGTMIAVKEADISIKLLGSIRNKLLDAFNEIWKTSV